MTYSDSQEELPLAEQHGTLLRLATDKLDCAVNDLDTRIEFLIRRVGAIVETEIIRNEIRVELETVQLGI